MWPEAYGIIGALREREQGERGGVIYAKDLTANPHGTLSEEYGVRGWVGMQGGALLADKGAFSILPKRVHEERESEIVKKYRETRVSMESGGEKETGKPKERKR